VCINQGLSTESRQSEESNSTTAGCHFYFHTFHASKDFLY